MSASDLTIKVHCRVRRYGVVRVALAVVSILAMALPTRWCIAAANRLMYALRPEVRFGSGDWQPLRWDPPQLERTESGA